MSFQRRFVAWVVTAVAAPLVALLVATASGGARHLVGMIFAAAVIGVPMWLPSAGVGAAITGLLAGGAVAAFGGLPALLVAALVHVVGVRWLAPRLPPSLDGAAGWRRVLWAILALLTVANGARLTAFMGERSFVAGAPLAVFPDTTTHQCMSAYIRAGELAPRVANVYDPAYYRGPGAPAAERPEPTTIEGLDEVLDDPFEYPPAALLLPRAGLALTHDYAPLRAGWYALQALTILALLLLLATWIGGPEGLRVGLFLPVVWTAGPTMMNFQYGQVHFLVVVASVAAMAAFAARRHAIGGALLGAAVATKVFPGLLLVVLVVRRRWRALAWTVLALAVIAAASLALVGVTPWVAFVTKQLPRLQSGEAFAFFENAPDVVANNLSVPGLVFKLHHLGVPGMTRSLESHVGTVYTLVLLAVAWRWARRPEVAARGAELRTWLALLNLAALRSPLAPSVYVGVGAMLMMVLVIAAERRSGWVTTRRVFVWMFAAGPPPLPTPVLLVAVSLVTQAVTVVTSLGSRWAPPSPARPAAPGES